MDKEHVIDADKAGYSPSSSLIGMVTAGGRSMVYQFTSFYLRAPMKLFRPARYDYTHYLRILLTGEDKVSQPQRPKPSGQWFRNPAYTYYLENSSVGVLTRALNKYGWKVLPDRVLPPLVLNSAAGVVLYTTYLSSLSFLRGPLGAGGEHGQSPPRISDVVCAGFMAGVAQAVASAPIDAIYTRSTANDLLSSAKKYNSLWLYGIDKLKEIGLVGCFGGFGLSLVKESVGFAVYFTTFELLKGQVCNKTIEYLEAHKKLKATGAQSANEGSEQYLPAKTTSEGYMSQREKQWLQRSFVFGAGVTAAFALQLVQYPMLKLQKTHLSRLEAFDIYQKAIANLKDQSTIEPKISKIRLRGGNTRLLHLYFNSYIDTLEHVASISKSTGTARWLYKGFLRNTLAIIPGTATGLLLLEYMRTSLDGSAQYSSPLE
ncbi:AEL060Cp [Eremothecium gossypii ATCC 10895]|uniref:AEL060Cp n=1 Tax=Eremothecium gossypii (strain ATCC 10895 / CBS 109.51 / FGSC 9923 / NRRL Y-1056) TaxID=284811 RepID=Q757S2_EREGS|nr:AEL060Cp [Eremothecium gossypii ATCC 10895]AAS52625.1 AEL060Cp [Eremothecium gossypii ATCC 10895]AEY96929.1 FAEL060Cp [Eremothecium gossypii FDAG1]